MQSATRACVPSCDGFGCEQCEPAVNVTRKATCPACAKLTRGVCKECFAKLQLEAASGTMFGDAKVREKSPLVNSAERGSKC